MHLGNDKNDYDELSVLCPGYIISPEGNIFAVKDGEDHRSAFENYLTGNCGHEELRGLHEAKQIDVLTNIFGSVVYSGIKTCDSKYIYGCNDTNSSIGYFFVPDDMNNITDAQRDICLKIIESNRSALTGREKIELRFETLRSGIGNQQELLELLTNHVSKKNV